MAMQVVEAEDMVEHQLKLAKQPMGTDKATYPLETAK